MAQVVTCCEGIEGETCYCIEESLDTTESTITSIRIEVSLVDKESALDKEEEDKSG